jgi:hypothetical protein
MSFCLLAPDESNGHHRCLSRQYTVMSRRAPQNLLISCYLVFTLLA